MWFEKIKNAVIGKSLNPLDQGIFHRLSLVAFFAWVGLGADGLSSSCYGPEEAYLALYPHSSLSIFVAMATAVTVLIISASYSQIIEVFPTGGGGYLVASKLLSPNIGMVSGCALLSDYLLTVTISVASGTDAFFSFFPVSWQPYKLTFAVFGVIALTLLNMRGVKESVIPLVPVFLTFIVTHLFLILYATTTHVSEFPKIAVAIHDDIHIAYGELGLWGMVFLILRAYSIGAGTYTGIEVVSNAMPLLRDPKVKTGKLAMRYMSSSLAFTVFGLMLAYLIYNVQPHEGRTLNAVLFKAIAHDKGQAGQIFIWVSLLSEALILFVAAQTGFIGGPRVLASMALDHWFPTKFAMLSDRLVTQNGILLMGLASLLTMLFTKGSVKFLVVLYSINVFITFCLSQLGMVRYWWRMRLKVRKWLKGIFINGIGLLLTTFILISVVILKFHDGGWISLAITGSLICLAVLIKQHYLNTLVLLKRLNSLLGSVAKGIPPNGHEVKEPAYDPSAKTAVIMVNGFNGLGLHTLFNVIRLFGREFRNFVFVEIGVIDAGNFKGAEEITALEVKTKSEVNRYVTFMKQQGYYAEGLTFTGIDVIHGIEKIGVNILERFPDAVFFGGQLVFTKETIFTKWLHNYTVFAMQRKFYNQGIPFVVMPIRV